MQEAAQRKVKEIAEDCQHILSKDSYTNGNNTSHTGVIYYYYKCVTAKNKKGCPKKTVKKD